MAEKSKVLRVLVRVVGVSIVVTLVINLFGLGVQQLCNHLMPAIFGLPAVTFMQALGLLLLSWIFFGSWRGAAGLGGRHRRHWRAMSGEQHAQFHERMRARWMGDRPESIAVAGTGALPGDDSTGSDGGSDARR